MKNATLFAVIGTILLALRELFYLLVNLDVIDITSVLGIQKFVPALGFIGYCSFVVFFVNLYKNQTRGKKSNG